MQTIKERQEEILEDFAMFENWMQKYEYLIELGKELPAIEKEYKIESNLIKGCQSKVWLHAQESNGKIYFSRHRPDGDWFQNAIANSEVKIQYNNMEFTGNASIVTDEELNKKISQLKYPGEERANEKRVAIEVTLDSK